MDEFLCMVDFLIIREGEGLLFRGESIISFSGKTKSLIISFHRECNVFGEG